jgi:signal transduction histidine kinase
MALVVGLAALFVYLRLASDLDQSINNGLRTRANDVATLIGQADSGLSEGSSAGLTEAEDNFAQVLTPRGRVFDATADASVPALTPAETEEALSGPSSFDHRHVSGIEGEARLFGLPVDAQDRRLVVVVGTSVEDRNGALDGLVRAFALGGPLAVLLASGIGYVVASVGLSPVEAMRRRAQGITLQRGGERLPLPVARDEIHRLGETLNSMLARLEASFERERRFVADASHELRTPIAVLRAELEVTLRDGSYDASTRDALVSAIEEADRLTRLAEDLLVIARADEGRLPIKRECVDVARLLEGCRERFAARAKQLGRGLIVEARPGLTAQFDPLRVQQALNNLVDNAFRHGQGDVLMRAQASSDMLEISVRDQGPGFPPQFAAQAFERFTRADPARGRGGSGLGLAIVSAIVRAHGGEAEVALDASSGATVRLHLPSQGATSGRS